MREKINACRMLDYDVDMRSQSERQNGDLTDRALVKTVINIRVPQKLGSSGESAQLAASQGALSSAHLVR
jgi:hypothetical protein